MVNMLYIHKFSTGDVLDFQETHKRTDLRRVIPATPVQVDGPEKNFLGFAKNVSRSGMFINTFIPFDVGDEFFIEFTLPDTAINVKCRSQVVWRQAPWNMSEAVRQGLKFMDIDPALADEIDIWVKKQD